VARPHERIPPALRGWTGPLAKTKGTVSAVIELQEAPSVLAFGQARSSGLRAEAAGLASQRQFAQIERSQQALLAPLASTGAQVIYRVQRAYNGIAVRVDASKLAELARLPGVKAIHPLVPKRIDNVASVPLIRAPEVWSQTIGSDQATGKGVKIAVIDTGIDYLHKGFGGPGTYPSAITDTTPLSQLAGFFPSAKVAGGYDFVGDNYNADPDSDTYNPIPSPDQNPIDCLKPNPGSVGHGTHVAGTAAGLGVLSNGETYTGPYNSAAYTNNTFRIGPGSAPGALLYALRVFGCDGSTDVVDQAIDWAVDPNGDGNPSDHVDVINMSLGSAYGTLYDTSAVAAENAVKAGVVVVATSGNSGDTHYITGSPASADSVISVAASGQPASTLDGLRVISGTVGLTGTVLSASYSVNYDWTGKPDVSGSVVYLPGKSACNGNLSGADIAAISGKILLIDWADGQCGSVQRATNTQAAGALGLVIADNEEPFDLLLSGNATLPTASIAKSTGTALKASLEAGDLRLQFSSVLINSTTGLDPTQTDVIADFSSRGVRRDQVLKPDISAPGTSIFSVLAASGNQGQTLQGTSMAAPHVAGVMAILKQQHPSWTPAELKALVMNTATADTRSAPEATSQTLPPSRQGAGRVDVANAYSDAVIAFDSQRPSNVSVSFGNLELTQATAVTRTVTITNKGGAEATYDVAYTPVTTIPGVAYVVSPASVTVPAGGSAQATIALQVTDLTKVRHTYDATLNETQVGLARVRLSEASGYLNLTPQAGVRRFTANIQPYYENPPALEAGATATGTFTYTAATNTLEYAIRFSNPYTITAAHIHLGAAGLNGGVRVLLSSGASNLTQISGSTTALTPADVQELLKGNLYTNFHTTANPGGEIRGQIVPAIQAAPAATSLRVPVHALVRAASSMHGSGAAISGLVDKGSFAGAIGLSGQGVNTGGATPYDTVSLVSALELQHISPPLQATGLITSYSDLKYVGISSNFASTNVVSETTVFFGIATQSNWESANALYVEVQIDTNHDGFFEYVLFTSDVTDNGDLTDARVTTLVKLKTDGSIDSSFGDGGFIDQYYLNVLGPDEADTQPYNTNVVVLAVDGSDLGLANTAGSFTYQVLTDSNFGEGVFDFSPKLRYTVSKPGIKFTNGYLGLSAYKDLPDQTIPFEFNRGNFMSNGSSGVLLLHHHNTTGTRAEAFQLRHSVLPIVRRP
jgi:subtilisin family serine protease